MANPYDSDAPVHRPGMESVVNRKHQPQADDPRDSSGNRTSSSRPAPSPPTRSAFGPDSESDPPPKTASSPPPASSSTAGDVAESPVTAIPGKAREAQIMDYVDKAAGTGS